MLFFKHFFNTYGSPIGTFPQSRGLDKVFDVDLDPEKSRPQQTWEIATVDMMEYNGISIQCVCL